VPRLKLKWAFGFADVTSARTQPALVGNRLFVASDAGDVHALDPRTGCAYWSYRAQATVRTALLVASYRPAAGGSGWYDFSASPSLVTASGRDLLVVPQKSGMAWALDPDQDGAIVWQQRYGQGSGRGGQWGSAIDGRQVYVGVNDVGSKAPGGLVALRLATGEIAWRQPAEPPLCGTPSRDCSPSQGAAVTAVPGAVLAVSQDGGLRAYAADDGSLLWTFDTRREVTTVNGVTAKGGSMDGPGPIVAGGLLFVTSGYGGLSGMPGNVLLVFGVD
jgi:polyvinyl alcohol dehydrogenase (cytochrome)